MPMGRATQEESIRAPHADMLSERGPRNARPHAPSLQPPGGASAFPWRDAFMEAASSSRKVDCPGNFMRGEQPTCVYGCISSTRDSLGAQHHMSLATLRMALFMAVIMCTKFWFVARTTSQVTTTCAERKITSVPGWTVPKLFTRRSME